MASVTLTPTLPAVAFAEKSRVRGVYSAVPVNSPTGNVKAGVFPAAKNLNSFPVPVATILAAFLGFPSMPPPVLDKTKSLAPTDKMPLYKNSILLTITLFVRVTTPLAVLFSIIKLLTVAGRPDPVIWFATALL